jgi:hypothetical protein
MSDPLTILDARNQTRYIILDEVTGHFYEVGTRNGPDGSGLVASYQDKASDQYAGVEIPCRLDLKEHIGQAEHEWVEHIETHAYLRQQEKGNKESSDYTSAGFRSAFEVEIRAYVAGNVAESARAHDVPLEGDIVFDRTIKDHRVQIGFNTTASEFRLSGMDQYYLLYDESATRKEMSEHGWQQEFSDPLYWISRGPSPSINRADSTTPTGTYATETDGADGKTLSALGFIPGGGLTYADYSIPRDFSIVFSFRDLDLPCNIFGIVWILEQDGNYYARIGSTTHQLRWTGTGWYTIMIKRSDNDLIFGENGFVTGTYRGNFGALEGPFVLMNNQTGDIFDFWLFEKAISDNAFQYYYTDLDENAGDALLPLW